MSVSMYSEIRVFSKDKDFLPKLQTALDKEWSCWLVCEYFSCPQLEPMTSVEDKVFRGKLLFDGPMAAVGDFCEVTRKVFKDFDGLHTASMSYSEYCPKDPGTGLLDNIYEALLFEYDNEDTCYELETYIRS